MWGFFIIFLKKIMSEYFEILKLESGPVGYELMPQTNSEDVNANIKNWYMGMVGFEFPRAIYFREFEFLKNLIVEYDLKNGYECATAFGVSAIALGCGFRLTGGHLITMDAYIEESDVPLADYTQRYRYETAKRQTNAMGYRSAKFLVEYFRLKDVVKIEVGYSPHDVGDVISRNISEKLDFVFIDAGHFSEQLIKDLQAVIPFLADQYVIALHDCYPYLITPEVEEFLKDSFGKNVDVVISWPHGYNMGVIINKQKPMV